MKATRLPIVFLLVIMSLVFPTGTHPIAAEVNTCPGTGPVSLALIPQGYIGQVGDQFDMIVQVQAGAQEVDTVSAFVNFDPAILRVLSITLGSSLPIPLNNGFDNIAGTIDLEDGGLASPFPSGTFTLATVRFQVLQVVQNSQIVYNCGDPRTTEVYRSGLSVLGALQNAFVPLPVTLASFDATAQADHMLVSWQTTSEIDNVGFNLYRATDPADTQSLLAFVPSQAPGSSLGFIYTWQNTDVVPGQTYWYWLEDVDLNGATTLHGPVSATVETPTAVTLNQLRISNQPTKVWPGWVDTLVKALHDLLTPMLSR